ncbi:hypothetical protein CsSME_00042780 [Camellia sinensis var. sinensis]
MASDLCIERNDSKWEIRDSPAKKQRCEGYASPPPPPSPSALCSSAEEEKEDPRSKIVFYNYDDDSDVEDDSDGMHEFTDKEFQEYDRQLTQSDVCISYLASLNTTLFHLSLFSSKSYLYIYVCVCFILEFVGLQYIYTYTGL